MFADNEGSITAVVDSNGHDLGEIAYDAFDHRIAKRGKREEEKGTSLITADAVIWPVRDGCRINYDSFGKIAAGSLTPAAAGLLVGYAGSVYDATTGLDYMNARYYDPASGRFLSEDPIDADQNPYRYVGNNPINLVDPSGLSAQTSYLGGGNSYGSASPYDYFQSYAAPHTYDYNLAPPQPAAVASYGLATSPLNFNSWGPLPGTIAPPNPPYVDALGGRSGPSMIDDGMYQSAMNAFATPPGPAQQSSWLSSLWTSLNETRAEASERRIATGDFADGHERLEWERRNGIERPPDTRGGLRVTGIRPLLSDEEATVVYWSNAYDQVGWTAALLPGGPLEVGLSMGIGFSGLASSGSRPTALASPLRGSGPRNPFGSKGKLDHRSKVEELRQKALQEAQPGETVLRERRVQGLDSNRRPDVQIQDTEGNTRKIFEAERFRNRLYSRTREGEYDRLGVPYETYPLD